MGYNTLPDNDGRGMGGGMDEEGGEVRREFLLFGNLTILPQSITRGFSLMILGSKTAVADHT